MNEILIPLAIDRMRRPIEASGPRGDRLPDRRPRRRERRPVA